MIDTSWLLVCKCECNQWVYKRHQYLCAYTKNHPSLTKQQESNIVYFTNRCGAVRPEAGGKLDTQSLSTQYIGPFVYCLRLEDDHFYIGYSKNTDQHFARINDHFHGHGSLWTKKWKPVEVVEIYLNASLALENQVTKKYMSLYGHLNVRGGSWTRVSLKREPTLVECPIDHTLYPTYNQDITKSRSQSWRQSILQSRVVRTFTLSSRKAL